MKFIIVRMLGVIVGCVLSTIATGVYAEQADKHFHPKGNEPSKHTIKILEQARAALPFDDTRHPSLQRCQ